jgi:hypothetical protein
MELIRVIATIVLVRLLARRQTHLPKEWQVGWLADCWHLSANDGKRTSVRYRNRSIVAPALRASGHG